MSANGHQYWLNRLQEIARDNKTIPWNLLLEATRFTGEKNFGDEQGQVRHDPMAGAYDLYSLLRMNPQWKEEDILTIVGLDENDIRNAKNDATDFAQGVEEFFDRVFRKVDAGEMTYEQAERFVRIRP